MNRENTPCDFHCVTVRGTFPFMFQSLGRAGILPANRDEARWTGKMPALLLPLEDECGRRHASE